MGNGGNTPGARLYALAQAEFRTLERELASARAGKDGGVHRARKSMQRLRALIRLLAPGDVRWALREDAAVRALRRRLGPLRDAAVRLELLESLGKRDLDEAQRARLALARKALKADLARLWQGRPADSEFWERVFRDVERLRGRLGQWPVARFDARAAHAALERSRRKLLTAIEAALGQTGRNLRHDVRRRLRRHAALRRLSAQALCRRDVGARLLLDLAREMGNEGDLWMACAALRASGPAAETLPLRRLLENERREACKRHDGEMVAVRRRWLARTPKPPKTPKPPSSAAADAVPEAAE